MGKRALVVGGGLAGMSCVLAMGKAGWDADLIDIDPGWRALGAGMTLAGPALRAFKALGVLADIEATGALSRQTRIVLRNGMVVANQEISDATPEAARGGGILRPAMHAILADRIKSAGNSVRLGITVTDLNDDGREVQVGFSDGSTGIYDLVIGADSLGSGIRQLLFGSAWTPQFTGQGCWRMVVPRPADVPGGLMYIGGPYAVGFNPVSATHMYMFLCSPDPDKRLIPENEQLETLRGLLSGYGGYAGEVRERMDETYMVNYRPLEYLFVDEPWHRGRVLLIGDAAHATTPHLGFGAGLAVEDSIVLGEELSRSDDLDQVFARFMTRRFERARYVVETSVRLSRMELANRWEERFAHWAFFAAPLAEPI